MSGPDGIHPGVLEELRYEIAWFINCCSLTTASNEYGIRGGEGRNCDMSF